MQVKGTGSEYIKIDISEYEITNLIRGGEYANLSALYYGVLRAFCVGAGQEPDAFIKDGKWFVAYEQFGGSHSWTETEEKGKATKAEVEIWTNLINLRLSLQPYE